MMAQHRVEPAPRRHGIDCDAVRPFRAKALRQATGSQRWTRLKCASCSATHPCQWQGPFQSGYGWHLVRVSERRASHAATLAEVESEVREGWLREARERAAAERLDALVKTYRIRRQDTATQP